MVLAFLSWIKLYIAPKCADTFSQYGPTPRRGIFKDKICLQGQYPYMVLAFLCVANGCRAGCCQI